MGINCILGHLEPTDLEQICTVQTVTFCAHRTFRIASSEKGAD